MTGQDTNGNTVIDRLEGKLLGTQTVLQVVLEKGLPLVGLNQALEDHRRVARERLEQYLDHRRVAFQHAAGWGIHTCGKG
ncbi:MAG: hypothetical protein OXC11_08030 [Rhodospirillales bacterium]|nr:hypothetical protein [Rhodospirillales bacterium]